MAHAETLAIVSFSAGACRFAVEAQQVDALLDDAAPAKVAAEALLGLPPSASAHRRCLRVGDYRVGVSEPVDLRALTVDQFYPLPELVTHRIGIGGVRALALEENGALLLVDLRALLAQHEESRHAAKAQEGRSP